MPSYFKTKDKRVRHIAAKFEIKRAAFQYLTRNAGVELNFRRRLLILKSPTLGKGLRFTVKSRNRCVITGRAGSVFRYFRLSRITLKQLASRGFLTGVRKSS